MRKSGFWLFVAGAVVFAACAFRVLSLPGNFHVPGAVPVDCGNPQETTETGAGDRLGVVSVSPDRATIGAVVEICLRGVVSEAEETRRREEAALRTDELNQAAANASKAKSEVETARKAQDAAPAGDEAKRREAAEQLKQKLAEAAKASAALERLAARRDEAVREKLAVFLNGEKYPELINVRPVSGPQTYPLRLAIPDDASSDVAIFWRKVLAGGASWDVKLAGRNLPEKAADAWKVRYAFKDLAIRLAPASATTPETTDPVTLKLGVYEHMSTLLGLVAFLLLTGALILFGGRSTLLRDNDLANGSFSLGRVQMLFWFVLTTAGFVFLWLTIGQYNSIMTTNVLALLGISGTTGLAAVAINGDKAANRTTNGFFSDLLGDGAGPQLQRIQAIAWTLILGLIFAYNAVWNFKFVEFGTELLLLMAFVNGLYLGFKPQEK